MAAMAGIHLSHKMETRWAYQCNY